MFEVKTIARDPVLWPRTNNSVGDQTNTMADGALYTVREKMKRRVKDWMCKRAISKNKNGQPARDAAKIYKNQATQILHRISNARGGGGTDRATFERHDQN